MCVCWKEWLYKCMSVCTRRINNHSSLYKCSSIKFPVIKSDKHHIPLYNTPQPSIAPLYIYFGVVVHIQLILFEKKN